MYEWKISLVFVHKCLGWQILGLRFHTYLFIVFLPLEVRIIEQKFVELLPLSPFFFNFLPIMKVL